jgi:hypothetical protein
MPARCTQWSVSHRKTYVGTRPRQDRVVFQKRLPNRLRQYRCVDEVQKKALVGTDVKLANALNDLLPKRRTIRRATLRARLSCWSEHARAIVSSALERPRHHAYPQKH